MILYIQGVFYMEKKNRKKIIIINILNGILLASILLMLITVKVKTNKFVSKYKTKNLSTSLVTKINETVATEIPNTEIKEQETTLNTVQNKVEEQTTKS